MTGADARATASSFLAVALVALSLNVSLYASKAQGPGRKGVDSARLKTIFADPPRRHSSGPLWVWNDMLREEQIISTLRDLAGQNVKQVFVHPRPGLMTPYLSDEWFRLWQVALDEAKRLDMNVWIYDENSYPSGFAGGLVPEAMPSSRGMGLALREQKQPPELSDDIVAVFRLDGDDYENVTEQIKSGQKLPESRYLVASILRAGTSGWFGGKFYVNLLSAGVTEKFLEITLEPYRKRFGKQFGKRICGVFTDEPHILPAGGHPWAEDFARVFEKKWGYKLVDHLPCLVKPIGDYKRVRHNFFQVALELFIERWAKPYYEYCQKYNLEFTGHYWEHEWPNCLRAPDNMAMYAWHQRPAIDTLMNQYREDTHAQFGNIRAVKELSSVAHQLGLRRTLCEAYGAGGWDLRFEDIKRIGDWLYVLGVNTLNEHLSYITIRGARKRDHPQSFSYHEPWWQDYHVIARYFTRLSAALSHGRVPNHILVIEPTTTAWMYQADPSARGHLNRIGAEFQKLVVDLAKAQVEFDLGCEDIIARHGSVDGRVFKIGRARYHTVVLPPLMENLNARTMELLEKYVEAGGTVFCCGDPPALVDGSASDRAKKVSQHHCWRKVETAALPTVLPAPRDGFKIVHHDRSKGILLHHRRKLKDGDLLFVTNTSIDSPCTASVTARAKSVELWDPETGDISPWPFTIDEDRVNLSLELPPCGSILLFLSKKAGKPAPADSPKATTIPPATELIIKRVAPNVLSLDYVDITAGGETKNKLYFYRANQFAFQKNGMDRNPWDSAVQFRDELISKKFPPNSGFEATYRFTIEDNVPKPLYIVIERPDLYKITCNGTAVSPAGDKWWLDKSFGMIDITAAARVGENTVTIKASPMTIYHELEPAYILGDFTLKAVDSGFVIVPQQLLRLGPWNSQGLVFYAAGVSYKQKFNVTRLEGRYFVSLPDWYGSVARVIVNGRVAGRIFHQAWECGVTRWLKVGLNTVEVVVVGTLKNTLGPHHGNPPLGSAWPAMFHRGPETGPPPGEKYHTVGYGLFKPFELINRR